RRALCAAGAVHRADGIHPRPVVQPAADGDRRRRGPLLRTVPRRGGVRAAAGMAALQRGALPHALRHLRDDPAGILPVGPARARRAPAYFMAAVLEVRALRTSFGGFGAVNGVSFVVY